jgi:ParB family chromosome partitioning protein
MPTPASKKKPSQKPHGRTSPPLPVTMVPVKKIDPSPLNRDAERVPLDPLVHSIQTHGLQEAIKVRPAGDRFEIVYGERRWRAFVKLGYPEIPATVEKLSDDDAQQLRIVENAHRADPHALEEAESFERLLALRDTKGHPIHTPEDVAKIAGRSIGHVYNRLKLTALAGDVRKALYANDIGLSAAFAIARDIPTELQPDAWKQLQQLAEQTHEDDLDDDGCLSTRAVLDFISRHYLNRLEAASFSLKDAKLVPAAGACQACAKRSGNQPHLFHEADPADLCTDLRCFQQKTAAQVEREKQRVLAVGGTVLPEDKSRPLFNGGAYLPHNSKWIDLDAKCYEHPDQPTWRKLLGDLCPPPTLAFTSQNKPVLLAEKAFIMDTLKAHGLDAASVRATATAPSAHRDDPEEDLESPDALPSDVPRDASDQRYDSQLAALTRRRLMAAIVTAAEAAPPDDNRFVQLLYVTFLHGGYHNAITDTVKRRFVDGHRPKEHSSATLAGIAEKLSPAALRALVLELAISRGAYFVTGDGATYSTELVQALDAYQLDPKPLEQAAAAELAAKRAARPAKAKPGSA